MSHKCQPVRGTHDCLPDEQHKRNAIIAEAALIAVAYGYRPISTPIFEFTEVFARTLGDSSDIVTKEMYTFDDRGGESLTLRPEFTAGIARAFLSNGLQQQLPCKFFAHGPVFRYERPQKGRMRQFHQLDVECIGIAEPLADAEVIAMGHQLLAALGLTNKTTLELNSLGDVQSRMAHREALVTYFEHFRGELSEDSQRRLSVNPLRILDSKDPGDRKLVADAPSIADYYTDESRRFIDQLQEYLGLLGIDYQWNDRLVRGLDYYNHTVFEFTTDQLGAQGAVLSGGRYDGLMEMMGGPHMSAIGWGAGLERLEALYEKTLPVPRPIAVIPISPDEMNEAFRLTQELRSHGVMTTLDATGNMKKRLTRAGKANARLALILGADEVANGKVTLRHLDDGEQQLLARDSVVDYCKGVVQG